MATAFAALNDETNEVVLLADVTISNAQAPEKPVSISGKKPEGEEGNYKLTFADNFYAKADMTFANVEFDATKTNILACGYHFTLGENITGTIMSLYGGGGTAQGALEESHITVNSGTITSLKAGGSSAAATVKNTNVIINGGNIDTVYGGGNTSTTETSNVVINDGTVTNVFGGGHGRSNGGRIDTTKTTNVTINGGTVSFVYGGGYEYATSTDATVKITGGTITSVTGGGLGQSDEVTVHTDTTNVVMTGGTVTYVYGGGYKYSTTGASNVSITGGTVTSMAFGGGFGGQDKLLASTESSNVTIGGSASVKDVYGGGCYAASTSTKVIIEGGTITRYALGGSYMGETKTTDVRVTGGTVNAIYAGSAVSPVDESTLRIEGGEITQAYGGGSSAGATVAKANTIISGGVCQLVYGGGWGAATTTANVTVNGGSIFQICGGGIQASTETATINVGNISVYGSYPKVLLIAGAYGPGSSCSNANINVSGFDASKFEEGKAPQLELIGTGTESKTGQVKVTVEGCNFIAANGCSINGSGHANYDYSTQTYGSSTTGSVEIIARNSSNITWICGTSSYDNNPVDGNVSITVENCTGDTPMDIHPSGFKDKFATEANSSVGGNVSLTIADTQVGDITYDAKATGVTATLNGTTGISGAVSAPVSLDGNATINNAISVKLAEAMGATSPVIPVAETLTIGEDAAFNYGETPLESLGNVYCVPAMLPKIGNTPQGVVIGVEDGKSKEIDGSLHVLPGAVVTVSPAAGKKLTVVSVNDELLSANDDGTYTFAMPEVDAEVSATVTDATSIGEVTAGGNVQDIRYFTTDGRPASASSLRGGIYIRIEGGKARKVYVR